MINPDEDWGEDSEGILVQIFYQGSENLWYTTESYLSAGIRVLLKGDGRHKIIGKGKLGGGEKYPTTVIPGTEAVIWCRNVPGTEIISGAENILGTENILGADNLVPKLYPAPRPPVKYTRC